MLRSTAGKARVGVVWLVTVGVLFLIAVFLAFMAQSDLKAAHLESTDKDAKVAQATADLQKEKTMRQELSGVLGWYADPTDAMSDAAKAREALEGLKSTFPDVGAAEKDFEKTLPTLVAAFGDLQRQVAEQQTRVKSLESELAAAQASVTSVTTAKDETIAGLRQQIADEQKNAEQRVSELESRLETQRTQLTEREAELRKAREDAGSEKRTFEKKENVYNARINALSDQTKFARAPFANQPDGSILEVSDRLGTGWIDRGANQRIVRGMRFQVVSGRPGDAHPKAWADVTDVKAGSAEVAFSEVVDRYDPVVAGDLIISPIYDPDGERTAVLLGRFSGAYTEAELTTLLAKIGVRVQKRLDLTTNFLIVGSELWSDPDTSEPLSEPIQPSELPTYKEAESQGVQIIPLQDIRAFFRAGAGT